MIVGIIGGVIAIIRACADRRGVPLEGFAVELAAQHDVDLT